MLVVGAGELGTAVLEALSSFSNAKAARSPYSCARRPSPPETLRSRGATRTCVCLLGVDFERSNFVNGPVSVLAAVFKRYDVVIQCRGYGMQPSI